jgi:TIR domain-containing protein
MDQILLKIFISYKWEDDVHNEWVQKFATDLRTAGYDAILDRWEVRFGDSFTEYMTSKINEADIVLFIMTTTSIAAAEAPKGEGGAVKFEIQMAASRKIAGEKMRLIGIYREGNQTLSYLRDHRYADFRDVSKYKAKLQELIDDLSGRDIRPPLGSPVDSNAPQYNQQRIAMLLNQLKGTLIGAEEQVVVDKWVNLEYVEKSGIAKELQDQGYDVGWSTANNKSQRVDLEGWEPVLIAQPDGKYARLKIHDHPAIGGYLIYLKKRKT